MSKKVTLNKLIEHVMSIAQKVDNSDENMYAIDNENINHIDEINLINLPYKEKKSIVDFPKRLKDLLTPYTKEVFRCGILNLSGTEQNISILSSILHSIDKSFREMEIDKQKAYINSLKNKMIMDINRLDLFNKFNYNGLNWTKKELRDSIKELKNTKILLKFLSDYFNINIFLIQVLEEKIYAIYSEEFFDKFKLSIIISFYNDTFEPIKAIDNYIFDSNNPIFKKLVNVNNEHIHILQYGIANEEEKIFTMNQNDLTPFLKEIPGYEFKKEESDNEDGKDEEEDGKDGVKDDEGVEYDKDEEVKYEEVEYNEDEEVENKEVEDEELEDEEVEDEEVEDGEYDDDNDNNYDEVSDYEDEVTVADINDTEVNTDENISDTEGENIFIKKVEDTKVKAKKNIRPDGKVVKKKIIKMKYDNTTKLAQLQHIAKKYGIDIENGKMKNGRIKYKTKKILIDELDKI